MQVGDMVIRKIPDKDEFTLLVRIDEAKRQRAELGHGIVTDKKWSGKPSHECLMVWYPKVNRRYWIAQSLMEVVSESA